MFENLSIKEFSCKFSLNLYIGIVYHSNMVETTDIINDLKSQEKRGSFLGLRKRKQMIENYKPSQKDMINRLPAHIKNAIKLTGEFKILEKFDSIIIAGIGINARAGDIVREYIAEYDYKVKVVKDFSLPENVNNQTLVFIASYNGNDEEAIACYKNALKGCKIIGITSGGRLADGFSRNNTEHILVTKNLVESATLVYILFPIIQILDNSQLIKSQKEIISQTLNAMKSQNLKDMAKQLYEKLQDKIPIIYSSKELSVITKYWKQQININSKVPCFTGVFSDVAYTELNSYTKNQWDFYLVFIRDQQDSKEVIKSMSTAKKIIKNKNHGTTEIMIKGSNKLSRLMSCAYIADFVSYFLGEYYSIEEDLVEKYRIEFKKI